MENQNVKRGPGRPKKYSTEEERKEVLKRQKSKYMINKEWYCEVCKNGKNYTLAGKHCHLNTKKHEKNRDKNSDITLDDVIRKEWIEFVKKDVFDTSKNP